MNKSNINIDIIRITYLHNTLKLTLWKGLEKLVFVPEHSFWAAKVESKHQSMSQICQFEALTVSRQKEMALKNMGR